MLIANGIPLEIKIIKNEYDEIICKVTPLLVDKDHPLFQVDDIYNAITIDTNYIGTLTMIGPGAGMYPTASVMVEDYVEIALRNKSVVYSK